MTRIEEVKAMITSFAVTQKEKGLDARLFLFGSRVRGDNRARSDFDLAIEAGRPLPAAVMADLRDGLEELPTLFRIDLVDAASVSDSFFAEAFSRVEELA
jgi:predicted nucleotidyltransferase